MASWILRRKNKLTEDHPSTWTKINIVAEIVSSSVMVISERCACEMKKQNSCSRQLFWVVTESVWTTSFQRKMFKLETL